jgi:hypothetical protein
VKGVPNWAVAAFPDKLMLLRCHPHAHPGEIRQPADMVPVRVCEQDGPQRRWVVACGLQLVRRGLQEAVGGDGGPQHHWQGPKLFIDVAAKAGINEEIALWVFHKHACHGKLTALEQQRAHPRHQGVDGQLPRRPGRGQGARVGFGFRQG